MPNFGHNSKWTPFWKHSNYALCCFLNKIAQGVYNRLLLVNGACFQRHQLVAVLMFLSVFQMMYEISHINRMGEKATFVALAVMFRAKIRMWDMSTLIRWCGNFSCFYSFIS